MILADSAVWVDHLRKPLPALEALLADDLIVMHPFVVGEISMGSIKQRARTIGRMNELPMVRLATAAHVAMLVEAHRLWGVGVQYIDAHLLGATLLNSGTWLWTTDKRLKKQAERLGVAYTP